MAILVCGGAGYIGSHTVAALLEEARALLYVTIFKRDIGEQFQLMYLFMWGI